MIMFGQVSLVAYKMFLLNLFVVKVDFDPYAFYMW